MNCDTSRKKYKNNDNNKTNPDINCSVKLNNLCTCNNDIKELQKGYGNIIDSNLSGYNATRLSLNLIFTLLIR